MDQSLLEALKNISVYDFVWTVSLLIIVTTVLVSQKNRISSKLNKWRKTKNKEEEIRELVYNLKDSLTSLKEEVNENKQESLRNRTHDREDSRKIRDEMYKIMNKQSEDIESLTKIVLDMKAQNSKTKRADIKEKLRELAVVLTETIRKNASIDWTIKENVRATMKVAVKRMLRKYGYPPDMQALATETVLKQAEKIAEELTGSM